MTNYERMEKYVEENCKNCKHKEEDLCDIRVFKSDNIIITRCVNYEKEGELQRYKKPLERTAKLEHTA